MDSPYLKGFEAFEDGWTIRDNPYPEDSPYYQEWKDGWLEAQFDYLLGNLNKKDN